MLICCKGGSASRVRDTPDGARIAAEVSMKANRGVYAYATPAYEVGEAHSYPGIYDTSVPEHILTALGPEATALYLRTD
jgi:hypothetical protein